MRLKEQRGSKEKKIMLSVPENWWKQTEMKTCHNCPVNLKMNEGVHVKLNFCWLSVFREKEHKSLLAFRQDSDSQVQLTSKVDLKQDLNNRGISE